MLINAPHTAAFLCLPEITAHGGLGLWKPSFNQPISVSLCLCLSLSLSFSLSLSLFLPFTPKLKTKHSLDIPLIIEIFFQIDLDVPNNMFNKHESIFSNRKQDWKKRVNTQLERHERLF